MEKKHFFLKLVPPRPTFPQDMSEEERNIMNKHAEYWRELMKKGIVIAYGPVMDPRGTYGIGIVEAENEEKAKSIAVNDPAPLSGLGHYEIYPMKVITLK